MASPREFLNERPWLGWSVAVVAIIVAVVFATGLFKSEAPDSLERRSETVTIRCTETGEEWTMNRGEFERLLFTQSGMIDPGAGIPSEFADGRLTGVLVDSDDWRETVERINAQKERFGKRGP